MKKGITRALLQSTGVMWVAAIYYQVTPLENSIPLNVAMGMTWMVLWIWAFISGIQDV